MCLHEIKEEKNKWKKIEKQMSFLSKKKKRKKYLISIQAQHIDRHHI